MSLVYQLSALEACLLSSLLSVMFVASLYVWSLCGYNVSDRNNSIVIKQRIISVSIICIISPIIISFFCHINTISNPLLVLSSYQYWKSIGVNFESFTYSIFYTLILMILLFLGPLVENPYHFHELTTKNYPSNLLIIRGLIIGPICEEWVYRGCIISVLYYGKLAYLLCIWIPPILFGCSHAHHIWYQLKHNFGISAKIACFRVAFQLFYTTIFGLLASIIFIRTGNVWSAMIMHIWCNCMGFPPFTFITQRNASPSLRDIINACAYVIGLGSFIFLLSLPIDLKVFNSPFIFN